MTNSVRTPSLRIVFAGTPEFAAQHLQALINSHHQIVAVYTQPDRPAGRGKKLTPSAVKLLAQQHQLPIEQPNYLKEAEQQKILGSYHADVMVVVAYGVILPEAILKTPRLGCINVHASLLPRWRGAAPIQRALLSGDAQTGVTIMQMDKGLDTGDMLLQKNYVIAPEDTSATLFEKLAHVGQGALLEALSQLEDLQKTKMAQDSTLVTYAEKLSKEDGLINWSLSAADIDRQIRGLNPWPVAFSTLKGERVRLWNSKLLSLTHAQIPGTILTTNDQGLVIACGKNAVEVTHLQLSGGKQLPFSELKKAHANLFRIGNIFENSV